MMAPLAIIYHHLSLDYSLRLLTHNLKAAGSNPAPATKKSRDISYLQGAPRGAFCAALSPGSTAEARGREVLGNKAKTETAQPTYCGSWVTVARLSAAPLNLPLRLVASKLVLVGGFSRQKFEDASEALTATGCQLSSNG